MLTLWNLYLSECLGSAAKSSLMHVDEGSTLCKLFRFLIYPVGVQAYGLVEQPRSWRDVCSHFRDSIKGLQVLVLLVAVLIWMLVFSARQEGQVCVSNMCLSQLLWEWHWPLADSSADSPLSVSSQLSLSSQDLQKQVFFKEKHLVSCLFKMLKTRNQKV